MRISSGRESRPTGSRRCTGAFIVVSARAVPHRGSFVHRSVVALAFSGFIVRAGSPVVGGGGAVIGVLVVLGGTADVISGDPLASG